MVLARDFEPAPRAVFALDPIVVADPAAGRDSELFDALLRSGTLLRMEDVDDGAADEFAIEVAEDAAETFARVKDGAVVGKQGEEFARRAQQRGELLGRKLLDADSRQVSWRTLRHGSLRGTWAERAGVAPQRWQAFMRQPPGAGDFAYGNDGHDSSRGNRDGDSLGEDEIAKPLIFNAET